MVIIEKKAMLTLSIFILAILFVCLQFAEVLSDSLNVENQNNNLVKVSKTGEYSVFINNQQWFSSSTVFFRADGRLFSTGDGSLLFGSQQTSVGSDKLGSYEKHALHWRSNCGKYNFYGNIFEYKNFIVFEQVFPVALENTTSANADAVISSFPSFNLRDTNNKQDTGYAQWVSWYYTDVEDSKKNVNRRKTLVAPGFDSPLLGRWNDVSANISGGMGGSGVICVFDGEEGNAAVVLSPLDNFMAVSHQFIEESSLAFGVMGNVTSVPSGLSVKTLLFVGTGINGAMREWGELMRSYYNKADAREASKKDMTLQYLGYTTDNGAYYYYNTAPGMNYQDTVGAIKSYADSAGIPYKYILLDSWFYYRGSNDGVKEWDGRPDIFPDGVQAVFENTGLYVQAHNRYWAPDAVYAKENGGKYDFVIDEINNGAVPTDSSFWDDLLAVPASSWGLRVYEQDWLFNEVLYVREMLESTSRARSWLLQMGNGATKNNLTVQYCMPYTRHLLQSLEVPAVTQARASDDYKPSEDSGQWRIGGQNILINALGLAPSKDGVYTVPIQDGNPYGVVDGEILEPFPRLQAVVVTLSAGPIAVADGIKFSDRDLIMRSCMKDGRLLVPSRPAMTIDQAIRTSALGTPGVDGEVWLAESIIGDRSTFFLFASEVSKEFKIYPVDLGLDPSLSFYAFETEDSSIVKKFSSSEPLTLKACAKGEFSLWTITTVESNAMSLQGELDKWISVSEARFSSITMSSVTDEVVVEVHGVADEVVRIGFVDKFLNQIVVECTFVDSMEVRRSIPSALVPGRSSADYLIMTVSSNGSCL